MQTLFIFIITISILVVVHEFGHFIVARWCGVKVERFSVGFGKILYSRVSKRGTEFAISAIPLGGYVKMLDSRQSNLSENDESNAFDQQKIWKRSLIVIAGPFFNFILTALIYWGIFQIGVPVYPLKLDSSLPNTPASLLNIPEGAELKSISGIQLNSWNDVNSSLISQLGSDSVNITYQLDDHQYDKIADIRNWRVDLNTQSAIDSFGFKPKQIEPVPIVSQIVKGSLAEKIGMKIGDEIYEYNGHAYDNWMAFVEVVKNNQLSELKIVRDNNFISLNIEELGSATRNINKTGTLGIYPTSSATIKQYGIVSAFVMSLEKTAVTVQLVAKSFYQLITGAISFKNLSGPISIAKGAEQTASYGVVAYLSFLAFISVSLGVVNLVPLPMLDGGHLLFLMIEKIKGSPLSEIKQAVCYRIGNFILVVIMGIALFNDFIRLSL